MLVDVELNRTITEVCRAAVGAMVKAVTGADGRVTLRQNFAWLFALLEKFGFQLPSPWLSACRSAGFPGVDQAELDKLFGYLRFCL